MDKPRLRTGPILLSLSGLSTTMSLANEPKIVDDHLVAARAFIAEHEKTVRPLEKEAALAWWNANVTGREEDFRAKEQTQNRLDLALSNHEEVRPLEVTQGQRIIATRSSPGRSPCST